MRFPDRLVQWDPAKGTKGEVTRTRSSIRMTGNVYELSPSWNVNPSGLYQLIALKPR